MIKPNDFVTFLSMIEGAGMRYVIEPVEGEHPCVVITTEGKRQVNVSFNNDGSLYAIHPILEEEWKTKSTKDKNNNNNRKVYRICMNF